MLGHKASFGIQEHVNYFVLRLVITADALAARPWLRVVEAVEKWWSDSRPPSRFTMALAFALWPRKDSYRSSD